VWEGVEPFEEHVHQLSAPDHVSCFASEHFKVADVLVDVWKVEGKPVEAGLGNFLLGRVCELGFESGQEIEVGILNVVVDRVKLFESFEDALHPSIYLQSFDKSECNCYMPDRGFEAWYPLVSHHVYPKFSNEGVCAGSVAVEQ